VNTVEKLTPTLIKVTAITKLNPELKLALNSYTEIKLFTAGMAVGTVTIAENKMLTVVGTYVSPCPFGAVQQGAPQRSGDYSLPVER
jgi:hypothetical protein